MIDFAAWPALLLLGLQCGLLAVFSFFSFFNYLYGFASLRRVAIPSVAPSGRRIAVVVVAFNEEHVVDGTLRACDALSWPNKLIVLADDSTDARIADSMRRLARARGCRPVLHHPFVQEAIDADGRLRSEAIEIWESPDFVYFHRPNNHGFKGGSLRKVHEFLTSRGIELMYLLDADWHPQIDALERTLGVLEAQPDVAFVQTKRISFPAGMNRFQRYVTLVEEGCYHVDFAGRQALGHPTLFSGCCTLFRLDAVRAVGGFKSGHLTEDLDLTNRLWLAGWKGVYLEGVVNHGEVPFTFDDYRRQQERWAIGSARAFRDYCVPILGTPQLCWSHKLSAIRQNGYFTTALLAAFTIVLGMATIAWLLIAWNSYAVESYLYMLGQVKLPFAALIYACLLSNFVEPVLMILTRKRPARDLLHLPMMIWFAWAVIPSYAIGNVKGFANLRQEWFRTPKFQRGGQSAMRSTPIPARMLAVAAFGAVVGFYYVEAWAFGWFDAFVVLIVPAFALGAVNRAD